MLGLEVLAERDLWNQIATDREERVEEVFEKGIEKGVETERSRKAAELREQGVSEYVIARMIRVAM